MNVELMSKSSAPEAAQETLAGVEKKYGFLPNLLGVMANAPPLLSAYLQVGQLFDQTSLSPTERQVVLLSVSAENECTYCVAAHTVIAGMQQVPQDVVGAIRQGAPLADTKLEALRQFAVAVVASRGWPSEGVQAAFLQAGYTPAQALEVLLGVGMKTLSNYVNHLSQTPLDQAFAPAAWTAPRA